MSFLKYSFKDENVVILIFIFDLMKADQDSKTIKGKAEIAMIPSKVCDSISKSLKQFEAGQTISFREFKERHFLKDNH